MTNLAKFMDNHLNRFFEPDDLFFKNFFDRNSLFLPAITSQGGYPVDAYETDAALNIEVAAAGLDKEDINIEECDGVLKVSYNKEDVTEDKNYIQKGIAKRSFSLGWKISDKYDLKQIQASLEKGILKIEIPRPEEKEVIKNKIEIKELKEAKKK